MIDFVCGTRPNWVKTAPVFHALDAEKRLIHTGQHYDTGLYNVFLEALDMPHPDITLTLMPSGATHGFQTAEILRRYERLLVQDRPEAVVVPGDVNSSLAVALAASKLNIPVIHIESGLRSCDMTMPEEQNRRVIDALSTLHLCPDEGAVRNLLKENVPGHYALVGNTMIDSLFKLLTKAKHQHQPKADKYVLVTLHRPSLVDDPNRLKPVLDVLEGFTDEIPIIFPAHPRTAAVLNGHSYNIQLLPPFDYLRFIAYEEAATVVVTDSGGVQEETTALGVPCLTYRTTTERPITCKLGTNTLIKTDPRALKTALRAQIARPQPVGNGAPHIPLWDGKAGERAATAIHKFLRRKS